jgi:hypothetical protein
MRPTLIALLALPTLACATAEEVCTAYDGTLCSDLQQDLSDLHALLTQLQADLDAAEATIATQQQDLDAAEATIADLQAAGYLTDDDLTDLRDDVAAHEDRLTEVEADYLTSADLVGLATESWVTAYFGSLATADDHEARIAAIEGDYLVSTDVADAVRLISADTIYACADATEVLAAVAELDGYRIAGDATVTLALDGTFLFTEPVVLAHPDGERIRIEGVGSTTTLLVFDTTDGIIVEGSSALGYLGDLTIQGLGQVEDGLTVRGSSAVTVGDLVVEGFGNAGILVEQNSSLDQEEGAIIAISDCGNGAFVSDSSYACLTNASAADTDNIAFWAQRGGWLNAPSTTASNSGVTAYYATMGSYLHARYSQIDTVGENGFTAGAASSISAENTDVTGAAAYAYSSGGNSYISAWGATGETTKQVSETHDTTDFIWGI